MPFVGSTEPVHRWRIVAVKDDKMVQLIADSVMKNLPPGRNGMQDEVRKQMERFLKPLQQ